MQIAEKRVGGLLAEVALYLVDGQVHVGEPPRRRIRFLTVDRDVGR